ncbi:MAG: hypothetical protein Q4D98_00380 [Planctomycetia bacterium]|nr:hypothetical protein [Planctomycetia bacterium]
MIKYSEFERLLESILIKQGAERPVVKQPPSVKTTPSVKTPPTGWGPWNKWTNIPGKPPTVPLDPTKIPVPGTLGNLLNFGFNVYSAPGIFGDVEKALDPNRHWSDRTLGSSSTVYNGTFGTEAGTDLLTFLGRKLGPKWNWLSNNTARASNYLRRASKLAFRGMLGGMFLEPTVKAFEARLPDLGDQYTIDRNRGATNLRPYPYMAYNMFTPTEAGVKREIDKMEQNPKRIYRGMGDNYNWYREQRDNTLDATRAARASQIMSQQLADQKAEADNYAAEILSDFGVASRGFLGPWLTGKFFGEDQYRHPELKAKIERQNAMGRGENMESYDFRRLLEKNPAITYLPF